MWAMPPTTYASNITGFRVANDGRLDMIPGSTRSLSTANAQPACVVFSPYGSLLAVSELTTNRISIFGVRADGLLTGPAVNRSYWRVAVRRLLPFHGEPAGDGDVRRAVILYRRRGWKA